MGCVAVKDSCFIFGATKEETSVIKRIVLYEGRERSEVVFVRSGDAKGPGTKSEGVAAPVASIDLDFDDSHDAGRATLRFMDIISSDLPLAAAFRDILERVYDAGRGMDC